MTSGSILHVVSEISTDSRPSAAATSLTSSTGSTASSTNTTTKLSSKKSSRRRRTSETLLATATAILKMLGVSTTSSSSSAAPEKGQSKINNNDKEMPAMQREKSASLSEVDYAELQKTKAAVEAKALKELEANASVNGQDIPAAASTIATPTTTTTTTGATAAVVTGKSRNAPVRNSVNDFRFGKMIGEGSFSTVFLAKEIRTGKEWAIKMCVKEQIIREKKQKYIKREREVMNVMAGCRGFVTLYCTFQDATGLYFVMTYAKNGDLLPHINKVGKFDKECTQFYAAELLLALENMHKRGVVHRDLKPENVLLDDNKHTLIADFGSAKLLEGGVAPQETATTTTTTCANGGSSADSDESSLGDAEGKNPRYQRGRKNSFVGTAQYVSPEILKGQPSSAAVDLWAFGCIIYQMVTGLPPFRGGSEYLIFQSILKQQLSFPDGFDAQAKDLVEKLLVLEPSARIGAKDRNRYDSIRSHPFFEGIDWEHLHEQEPPKMYPHDATGQQQQQAYKVPDNLEPGLGQRQLARLLGMDLGIGADMGDDDEEEDEEAEAVAPIDAKSQSLRPKSIADVSPEEKQARLEKQKTEKWDAFAEGELILKQGVVSKRKGVFARKRMLLLTTGPRLIYIDPAQMVKKGEIPWSQEMRVEAKSFKVFFVHTPNRTYYLEDPDGFALKWCDAIKDMHRFTYGDTPATSQNGGNRVTEYRYSST